MSVDNDQIPYDYEQGLCAWCREGFYDGNTFATVRPHRFDCPYFEALGVIAREAE